MHHYNLLDKTIKEYLKHHKEDSKKHIRDQLEPPLKRLHSYSRFKNPNLVLAFQTLHLEETIEELKKRMGWGECLKTIFIYPSRLLQLRIF